MKEYTVTMRVIAETPEDIENWLADHDVNISANIYDIEEYSWVVDD